MVLAAPVWAQNKQQAKWVVVLPRIPAFEMGGMIQSFIKSITIHHKACSSRLMWRTHRIPINSLLGAESNHYPCWKYHGERPPERDCIGPPCPQTASLLLPCHASPECEGLVEPQRYWRSGTPYPAKKDRKGQIFGDFNRFYRRFHGIFDDLCQLHGALPHSSKLRADPFISWDIVSNTASQRCHRPEAKIG